MSEVITPVTVIGDSAIGGTATVDSGDISVVAGNLSAVDIVSNNIDSVVTDANSIDSINTLAASNSQLLNLNSNLSTIETVNSKLGEINRYYTTFLGSSATDPTVRVDGSPLQVGDMYYSTTMPGMKVRGATAWATSAGGVPVNNSTLTGNTSIQNLTVSNAFNANGYAQFNSSDAFKIPSGTTAQRPSPVSGQLRFNITTGEFEGFNGLVWGGIGGTTSSGGSAGSTAYVRQTFTATAGQTTFTITGGYTPGKIDVFKNGIKLVNGSTVTVTNGASVVLSSGATAGDIIDVVGLASGYFDSPAQPRRLAYTATAGQTLFNVVGGYTPNQLDVFQNGTKLVTGTDVDVSSGTTFTLVTPATVGDTLEVVGFTAADTISGTLKFHAGTASAPSITAFEDTDTGVYFPAANTLAVTTNGVQRVSVDGSGATSLTGNLSVSGTSTLSGNTSVTGNTTVGGTLGVTGNTTVGGTLGVTGNTTVGGTLGVTGTSTLTSTSITGAITGSTNVINIGSGQIYKDASGNVGVGTTSPATKLHVEQGLTDNGITVSNVSGSYKGRVYFDYNTNQFVIDSNGDVDLRQANGTNNGTGALAFYTALGTALGGAGASTEKMRITGDGNVGIGTTSIAAKLHVYSASAADKLVRFGPGGISDGNFITTAKNGVAGAAEGTPQFSLGMDYSTTYTDLAAVKFARGAGAQGNILFLTGDQANGTERLRIDESGNVGIRATSPVSTLTIGSGTNTYPTTPNSPLGADITLNASNLVRLVMNDGTGNFQQYLNSYYDASTGTHKYTAAASPACRFTTSGGTYAFYVAPTSVNAGDNITWTTAMYMDNSGNVGVGTASPAVKLDVAGGNIQGKEIFLQNGAASSPALGTTPSWYSPASGVAALSTNAAERLRIEASGNVGIGTTTPTERLDVAGNAKVSGTITVGGTKVVRPTVYTGFAPASTTRTVEFTGIPAHVEEVTIILVGLGMNTTDIPYIQLGTASGYLGAGSYAGATVYHSNTGISSAEYNSAAFLFGVNAVQTYRYHGKYVMTKVASNYWHIQGSAEDALNGRGGSCNYGVSLGAGSLTKLKVEVGTGVFDEGSVYCIY